MAGTERAKRWGWVLTALGLVVILWAVLRVTSAAYGTSPRHKFAERRSYDQIKVALHAVFPGAFAQGLAGLGLILVASKLRSRAE